ncbi:MAG: hypothetical protein IT364_21995 [Candidatus Hydrogenedentes bacterium]|nr:hypothetical protein [Candidatus Hydrogenedentota bacterium]
MRVPCLVKLGAIALCVFAAGGARAQTAQVGADADAAQSGALRIDYVHYRPARWNVDRITEYESEFPNQGGLLYFYLTNTSATPVSLRFWRYNNRDESYWVLNHFVAWHRLYDGNLEPGESTVLEISGTERDFGPDVPYAFSFVDSTWEPCLEYSGVLKEDEVNITNIRFMPGLKELEIHLRNSGRSAVECSTVEIPGYDVEDIQWRGQKLQGSGQAIARIKLSTPIPSSTLAVVRVTARAEEEERHIYAHRRAFADFFPIGTWGIDPKEREFVAGDHVDAGVAGGKKDDEFFGGMAAKLGLRAMVHTGEPVNVDMVRDLSGHPSVACWMLRDEPDWSTDAQVMLFCDSTVRAYDTTIPTFINLCRNTQYFNYAAIPDIAGHDHYCVTAPSSSKWPKPHGTYLEETAYYTEDLKYAAAPRPIWVWSQGNHDGWSERPLRPLPTPEEISAQLVLNLSRGAKGILWFTYNKAMSEKYPETRECMRGWNRVMAMLREDFLASEPYAGTVAGPRDVDAAVLVSWDKLILCVTNLDYEIDPVAYPFTPQKDLSIKVDMPEWLTPATALRVSGSGLVQVPCKVDNKQLTITLDEVKDAAIVVVSGRDNLEAELKQAHEALMAKEASLQSAAR